ncbi:hypothetical protein BS50DRAFT_625314 [Corynespora cassiicola Philippines]|uniref:Uncharacterized protein n=1 Tax=Corynespora cassiicola Philippines TaxID=1448308 RepID=A0A2T2N7S3_CORCC|nr:hypothetical protein BS50DRAFT_625314 [Corynespora cassiicola Philippines]
MLSIYHCICHSSHQSHAVAQSNTASIEKPSPYSPLSLIHRQALTIPSSPEGSHYPPSGNTSSKRRVSTTKKRSTLEYSRAQAIRRPFTPGPLCHRESGLQHSSRCPSLTRLPANHGRLRGLCQSTAVPLGHIPQSRSRDRTSKRIKKEASADTPPIPQSPNAVYETKVPLPNRVLWRKRACKWECRSCEINSLAIRCLFGKVHFLVLRRLVDGWSHGRSLEIGRGPGEP